MLGNRGKLLAIKTLLKDYPWFANLSLILTTISLSLESSELENFTFNINAINKVIHFYKAETKLHQIMLGEPITGVLFSINYWGFDTLHINNLLVYQQQAFLSEVQLLNLLGNYSLLLLTLPHCFQTISLFITELLLVRAYSL